MNIKYGYMDGDGKFHEYPPQVDYYRCPLLSGGTCTCAAYCTKFLKESEPNGGNMNKPHLVMITSGEYWRCQHGRTTLDGCKECAPTGDIGERSAAIPEAVSNAWDRVWGKWQGHPGLQAIAMQHAEHGNHSAANILNEWIESLLDASPTAPTINADDAFDNDAVDQFADRMKAKLNKKRLEGRGNWFNKKVCTAEELSEMLIAHVAKGDPVDVANFCMMLSWRGERIDFAAAPQGQDHVAGKDKP